MRSPSLLSNRLDIMTTRLYAAKQRPDEYQRTVLLWYFSVIQFRSVLSLWRLSSPPSGPVQRASDAASGQSVDAAPASGSETVNYSSKQRSHSVAMAPTGMKFSSLTCSQNVRRDVCHQPLRANSPVHLVTSFQLPFPTECVGCSLCGSLRGGMRRFFFLTPAACKSVLLNRGKARSNDRTNRNHVPHFVVAVYSRPNKYEHKHKVCALVGAWSSCCSTSSCSRPTKKKMDPLPL